MLEDRGNIGNSEHIVLLQVGYWCAKSLLDHVNGKVGTFFHRIPLLSSCLFFALPLSRSAPRFFCRLNYLPVAFESRKVMEELALLPRWSTSRLKPSRTKMNGTEAHREDLFSSGEP